MNQVTNMGVTAPDLTRVEESIIHLVKRTRLLWSQAAAQVHPDLQPVGYRILTHLQRQGPTNPGHLADLLDTDKSVISRQARILEDMGLLQASSDPADGRCRIFAVTDSADEVLTSARTWFSRRLAASLSGLGDGEVTALADLLDRVNSGIDGA